MNLSYDICKELKDAGFRQEGRGQYEGKFIQDAYGAGTLNLYMPTLSELVEACGEQLYSIVRARTGDWRAYNPDIQIGKAISSEGPDPETAVARLWLALQKKV